MDDKWISVKDRLPALKTNVLFFNGGRVECGYYSRNKKWWIGNGGDFEIGDASITHWQPLPEPPQNTEDIENG